MSLILNDIKMPLTAELSELSGLIAAQFSLPKESVQGVRLVRQSIDARRKSDIHFRAVAVVQLENIWQSRLLKSGDRRVSAYTPPETYALMPGEETPPGRIVIAGLGPAGLFAAYFLAQAGYAPLVIERGRDVDRRKEDVERFWETGRLEENSNVAFGEGGAGTFSDGKLTSRSKNARMEVVLKTLVDHGAPEDIAYQAKPHIGTDRLQLVVKRMREAICAMGGEIRFETRLRDIQAQDGKLTHILLSNGGEEREKLECAALILATGQAAPDIYELLLEKGAVLLQKPFAVGLRIEHPQGLIDRAQFGALAGHPRLGAAEYRLTAQSGGRGVYTFCMCPGGEVVAAASEVGGVVVNGMSYRARAGSNANAAILVQVGPGDFGGDDPLAGLRFRRGLEESAYLLSGGGYHAPAQRLEDFLQGKKGGAFHDVQPTYRPGVVLRRLDTLLPDYVTQGIREGIGAFARQLRGFDHMDAVLTGVESRSSSPVRIVRDEGGEAPGFGGLYPVGEGAGYAGGIMSAALDGMLAAERVAMRYAPGR